MKREDGNLMELGKLVRVSMQFPLKNSVGIFNFDVL